MATVLRKQFKDFPVGTLVKVHSTDSGIITMSVPPFNPKYMVPANYVTKGVAVNSPSETAKKWVASHQTEGSTLKPHDWRILDAKPITYPGAQPSVCITCYCRKAFRYYAQADLAIHAFEKKALSDVIASCSVCSSIQGSIREETDGTYTNQ